MKKTEACLTVAAVTICGALLLSVVVLLSISITAGIAMLVCNWALPMFDIDYPITFTQGCGIGVIVIAVRAVLQGLQGVQLVKSGQ